MSGAAAVDTQDVTILVVDDEPDMRFLVRAILEGAGVDVVGEATDGYEALEIFRTLAPPPVPTVILLDNRMPGPSGLEVAAQLLADVPHQLIVLFTAFFDEQIEAEALRLGVARCVSKKDAGRLPEILRALVESL